MKKICLILLTCLPLMAEIPVPRPATQTEVNAGTAVRAYVTPDKLAAYSGGTNVATLSGTQTFTGGNTFTNQTTNNAAKWMINLAAPANSKQWKWYFPSTNSYALASVTDGGAVVNTGIGLKFTRSAGSAPISDIAMIATNTFSLLASDFSVGDPVGSGGTWLHMNSTVWSFGNDQVFITNGTGAIRSIGGFYGPLLGNASTASSADLAASATSADVALGIADGASGYRFNMPTNTAAGGIISTNAPAYAASITNGLQRAELYFTVTMNPATAAAVIFDVDITEVGVRHITNTFEKPALTLSQPFQDHYYHRLEPGDIFILRTNRSGAGTSVTIGNDYTLKAL